VGFDKEISYRFWYALALQILELSCVGVLCLSLLYLFRRKILKIVQSSEAEREKYRKKIRFQMREPLNLILLYSDFLGKYLRGEIDVGMNRKRQLSLVEKIHELASNLDTITVQPLHCSYVDVNKIIQESIAIQSQNIFMSGVYIKTNLDMTLNHLYSDELYLKQIIVGLMTVSLNHTPEGGTIKISTALKTETDKSYAVITIKDNGFSLDQRSIERLKEKLSDDDAHYSFDGLDLDFSKIENLITLHQGTFQILFNGNHGKTI
jgi:light-regulated signal transduction histidine kinase (bacteriophytochrome)